MYTERVFTSYKVGRHSVFFFFFFFFSSRTSNPHIIAYSVQKHPLPRYEAIASLIRLLQRHRDVLMKRSVVCCLVLIASRSCKLNVRNRIFLIHHTNIVS
ncbi:hypothetical protein F5Y08DRAFT_313685 [Xylaria arbuscula]|nr:hypothetical protein F5Y08DRAFT_313685 [Xylaria arbuscula]